MLTAFSACDGMAPLADAGAEPSVLVDGGTQADAGPPPSDGGQSQDAGATAPDAGEPTTDAGPTPTSSCVVDDNSIDCPYASFTVNTGLGPRRIHVATPAAPPPPGGYPVVLFFQGSFFPGEGAFGGTAGTPFGQFFLADTVRALLDAGFVVAAPNALAGGTTFWQTNIAPFAVFWEDTADDLFIRAILNDVEEDRYASTDASKLFAMGISSGGFMTSRMAVSYEDRFTALAIHSGSYATCGAVCFVPEMPSVHPPTLFVHGEDDLVVHPPMMRLYRDALDEAGFETQTEVVEGAHAWLEPASTLIPAFFTAQRDGRGD